MDLKRTSFLIWIGGGLALVLGLLGKFVIKPDRALPLPKAAGHWCVGFASGGAYATTNADSLPSGLATVGSWNDGDTWQGRGETVWVNVPQELVSIWVAG